MASLIDAPTIDKPSSTKSQGNLATNDSLKQEQECPHCNYKDSYEEVFGSHLNECPQLIIPCSNKDCKEKITRISMMEHASICPKGIIHCQYSIVGCYKKFKREDKTKHEMEYSQIHLKLAVRCIKELKERPPRQSMIPGELTRVTFKLNNFTELKQQRKHWISPTFYTSIGGYKLVMVVFPNGYDEDEGTHVSCFVCLLPGENDAVLQWPMRGEISIELLNQIEDDNHTLVMLAVEEESEFYQVDEEEIENIEEDLPGVGQSNLIEQTQLDYDSELNLQYLKDDCLFFRVTVTKLCNKPAERPWLITTTH